MKRLVMLGGEKGTWASPTARLLPSAQAQAMPNWCGFTSASAGMWLATLPRPNSACASEWMRRRTLGKSAGAVVGVGAGVMVADCRKGGVCTTAPRVFEPERDIGHRLANTNRRGDHLLL